MGNVPLQKIVGKGKGKKLTKFQRRKLKYDFDTFFDLNKDGHLSYNDFLWAKDKICFMSGWRIDSDKYKETEALFKSIWTSLEILADVNKDGKITKTEWLLLWTEYKKEIIAQEKQGKKDFLKNFYNNNRIHHGDSSKKDLKQNGEVKNEVSLDVNDANESGVAISRDESISVVLDSDEEPLPRIADKGNKISPIKTEHGTSKDKSKKLEDEQTEKNLVTQEENANVKDTSSTTEIGDSLLPKWLTRYLQFRFNLLDRTSDGVIDNEEFEYVLSEFGCSERIARQAFTIVTKNKTVTLDFDYFVQLFEQFYLSDDPSDLGNFINGKLDFEAQNESADDASDVEDEDPGLEDHKVDSNASLNSMDDDLKCPKKKKIEKDVGSTIRLHETVRRYLGEKCDDAISCCVIL